MVYAQPVAKDTTQAFHYLHRKGNLRQQEEHLLMLLQGFQNEVYVQLRLSTGCDAMQQYNLLAEELQQHLVVCLLLVLIKPLGLLGRIDTTAIQTTYFLFISIQYFLVH